MAGLAKTSKLKDNNNQNTDVTISTGEIDTIQPQINRICAINFDPEFVCISDNFTTIDSVQDCGLEKAGVAVMASINPDTGMLEFENI